MISHPWLYAFISQHNGYVIFLNMQVQWLKQFAAMVLINWISSFTALHILLQRDCSIRISLYVQRKVLEWMLLVVNLISCDVIKYKNKYVLKHCCTCCGEVFPWCLLGLSVYINHNGNITVSHPPLKLAGMFIKVIQ